MDEKKENIGILGSPVKSYCASSNEDIVVVHKYSSFVQINSNIYPFSSAYIKASLCKDLGNLLINISEVDLDDEDDEVN